jgi:hypothetical protein
LEHGVSLGPFAPERIPVPQPGGEEISLERKVAVKKLLPLLVLAGLLPFLVGCSKPPEPDRGAAEAGMKEKQDEMKGGGRGAPQKAKGGK